MFFYDNELQLYINDEPLLISSKVQKAANKVGIPLVWDQGGYVHQISYEEAKKLCTELGIIMLSVKAFMNLAKRHPRVASPHFAEWLDDTYSLADFDRMIDSSGQTLEVPTSRPGWFELDSVGEDGLPTDISLTPGTGKWKFWTQNDKSFKAAAARSFVTSSGTCSLDLGIPSFAKHPNFMVRECYRSKPFPVSNPLDQIWIEYEEKTLRRDDNEISEFFKSLDLPKLAQSQTAGIDEFVLEKNKEKLIDLYGKNRILEDDFSGLRIIDLDTITAALVSEPDDATTYVIGHSNPDADAIVGAVFEAVRRTVTYKKKCVAWAQRVPNVVRHILGEKICDILANVPKFGPTHDIVLVDCHTIDDGQEYQVKSIIDHHIVNRTFPHYISITQEVSWSSTIQIYIKFLGSGLDLDCKTARLLLEATLIEAEPGLMENMSRLDRLVLERLKNLAEGHESYPNLMGLLTRDTMRGDPFMMDYKQGLYGFSVIKTQQPASYAEQARANNIKNRLPLTIVKQVVYDSKFKSILKETISMYFNKGFHDKGFKRAVMEITKKACEALHGSRFVTSSDCEIEMTNVSHQTPRLLLAPLLEDVVKEHLRFFRSKEIGAFIACGFYTSEVGDYAMGSGESLPSTKISFDDVKQLLSKNKATSFLSLPQYWQVYRECEALSDTFTLKSLRDPNYVELLDTLIYQGTDVVNCDRKPSQTNILDAKPALIRPQDINNKSGFPNNLISPDTYCDSALWRYWSPDRAENVATRGHIFVMNQTCIDLKIGRHEKTQQLTFRPVYQDIPDIKYSLQLTENGKWVKVVVFPRLFSIKSSHTHLSTSLSPMARILPKKILSPIRELQSARA